ncbi:MAG TPA: hypothetical protein VK919_13080 [Solirubrobacterales bacterium]|nr:hypothetical protein [Solirubrobacterales bacterium]
MRTEARYPHVGASAGHYESFYIKATRPGGGQGVWIRHTVRKPPGAGPTGSLWLTVFDSSAPGPRATKATHPPSEVEAPAGGYIRIADSVLEPGRARGSATSDALGADWDLRFESALGPLRHLPYGFLYRAPLPRTKLLSPYPAATFTGTLTVGGEQIELDRWPGMVGHNWGAEHAERWVWLHAPELDGADGYLDVAAGRIKVGGWTSPWIANGVLRLDGEDLRLGGLDRIRSTKLSERPTRCDFSLRGKGTTVRGRVAADPTAFVAWVYADPDGPEHHTLNCSIADLELTVEHAGSTPRRLEARGAAAYEIGMRETDHGIPLQPYPDG